MENFFCHGLTRILTDKSNRGKPSDRRILLIREILWRSVAKASHSPVKRSEIVSKIQRHDKNAGPED
jgi:hypothetical protein